MIAVLFFASVLLVLWASANLLVPRIEHAVRHGAGLVAQWLRAHERWSPIFGRLEVKRSYAPLVVTFAIGAAVILWAGDAFIDIATALHMHNPLVQQIDITVYHWLASRRTPALNVFFVGATMFGSPVSMASIVAIVIIALLVRRRFRWAAYLGITAAGGAVLNELLKHHFVRARPDLSVAVLRAEGYSFPSGHAMGSTIVLGALAYLAARALPTWRAKSAAFSALFTSNLAIAIPRLYLGVHWTSDVAAGLAAGLLWLTGTTAGYEVVRQHRLRNAKGIDRSAERPV